MQYKTKFVDIYEQFYSGKDPSLNKSNFWNELFLMRVDVKFLQNLIVNCGLEQFHEMKDTTNSLFFHCVETINEGNSIRVLNATQTLCVLIREIYSKYEALHRPNSEIIDCLIGHDSANSVMKKLSKSIAKLISDDESPPRLRSMALKLCLVICVAADNLHHNILVDHLMQNDFFFQPLAIYLMSRPALRDIHGAESLTLLVLLVNYRRAANPYAVKLSILDDERALDGMGHVISRMLSEFNHAYCNVTTASSSSSNLNIFSSITDMFSNMLTAPTDDAEDVSRLRVPDSIIAGMFHLVYLNRNFISVLTRNHTISTNSLNSPPQEVTHNMLVSFIEYTSFLLSKQHPLEDAAFLALTALQCIVEDSHANNFLHDDSILFRVNLQRPQMRHRRVAPDLLPHGPRLVHAIYELISDFISTHLMRRFPRVLYVTSLSILHRLLCYARRCRLRIGYSWSTLWQSLSSLLRFLSQTELTCEIEDPFSIGLQAVHLFNMFITFGDTFLASPLNYDELYYEIVRNSQVFEKLHVVSVAAARRDDNSSALALVSALCNLRSIGAHFGAHICQWLEDHPPSVSIPREDALNLLRANYDSLTLRLHDGLDHWERCPHERLLPSLISAIVRECRKSFTIESVEQRTILQEFSTIN